ncbi:MAG: beta-galactosidase [Eubacterium sp.]|nr:beta-galactosidase [Eubacterium sp.]
MDHSENTLFGAAYYDEYMPYDRIDTDFRLMKEAGMNVIRIAESTWSTWEPEDGRFDFSHLHRMLEYAEKYDINVIVGTPTYAVPAWLVKKYPEIMALGKDGHGKDGRVIYGHRQIHNIMNPDFRRYAERIIRKLMEFVADNPMVIGYQIDNETRSGDDYSPYNQALFVESLKTRYPDIEDFNHEFGLDYWSNRIASWEDFPDVRGTINGSLSAAYKAWLRDTISEYQSWQSDIINEYKRPAQFITHNYDFSWKGYSHGIQPLVNQNDAAKAVDIAGVDIYHLSQDRFDGAMIAFGGAIGRSMKKDNYIVLETQSQGRLDWLPYPGQLRQAYYSHLASGANGVMYWNWHSIHNAIESYWKGILSHDLLPGETYKELKSVREEALSFDIHLKNLTKNCKAAILVDNRSLVGLDEFPIDEVSEKNANEKLWDGCPESLDYNHILRWVFDTCYKMNLEVDIIYKSDLLSSLSNINEKYSIIFTPALYSAGEAVIEALKEYVKNGGHLIATFKSFFADEEIKIYSDAQPHMMTDLVGGTYDRFTRPVDMGVVIDGSFYRAAHWMELLEPSDGVLWGKYYMNQKEFPWPDCSAILHKETGKGSMTYIGCFMEEAGLEKIIRKVIEKTDIKLPEFRFPVIRKEGVNALGEHITYYFNYSGNEVTFRADDNEIKLQPWGVRIIIDKETK